MEKKRLCLSLDGHRKRKILLRMRLCISLLLCFTLGLSASTLAQQERVNLDLQKVSFKVLFSEIQKQTNLSFVFNTEQTEKLGAISVRAVNETVESVLRKVLVNTGMMFEFDGTLIIIRPEEPEKKEVTKIKVSGTVKDEKGESLPGVTILLKGTQIGSVTDFDGRFNFELPKQDSLVLVFSFIGYKQQEVRVKSNDTKPLSIVMHEDITEMDEVVVTGIYQRKKESFTGSTATFKKEELKMVGSQNLIQSLRTLDPSFAIMENNQFGSDPNRLPDIEIRGKTSVIGLKEQFGTDPNQPLFILDGFETTLQVITDLNMERVESVTILKDAASTAIYGSKAANGVVVIETKKPEQGKFKISYVGDFSVSMPDLSDYNLMNAEEKLEFEKLAGYYTASSSGSSGSRMTQQVLDSLYNSRRAEVARGVNTYWLHEPLRVGFSHKHNLYAEGGDDAVRYGLGINYNNISGVMKQSRRNVIGGNFDLSYRKGKISFANKFSLDYNKAENPTVPFSEFSRANPYYRKTGENGKIERYLDYFVIPNTNTTYSVGNPLWNASLNNLDEEDQFSFRNNLNLEWRIMPTLYLRGRLGIGKGAKKTEKFVSPQHSSFDNYAQDKKGRYTSTTVSEFYYDGDLTLTYGALLKEVHQINAVIGTNLRSSLSTNEGYSVSGFPNGNFTKPPFSNGFTEGSKPTYSETESRSHSVYFNGGYAYDNRYLLDVNFRLDGSSAFGSNKRYTETWAVGLAWNLHNEPFLRDAKWMNLFKIRASIGNPGNQNFSSYQSITSYSFNTWMQSSFGTSVLIDAIGNPNLKWQKTLDKNIGVDIALLGNRLNFNMDYFVKDTDALLVYITVPSSVGITSVGTNMGSQLTKGINGTVKYSPIYRPSERINWTLSVNFRWQKARYENIGNSLEKLNEANREEGDVSGDGSYRDKNTSLTRYYDGGDPNSLWAVRSLGIDPSTGREVFMKKDGTYTFEYDVKDEVIVGNSQPKLEGVLGSTLYYKGFSFSFYFRYKLGADVFNNAMYTKVENISESSLKYNQDKRALYDRWQKAGDRAQFKGISLTETTKISSRFVQREDVLSGESISAGYDFNPKGLAKFGVSAIRLQANMNDIFRVSSVKEERGIDYPFARTMSMSLSVTF